MKTEHNSYPVPDDENRTTPPATPERRAPPQPRTRHEARILEQLSAEHGAAFDVYLEHVWNGTEAVPDLDADFQNLHWASYDRIEHFVDDFIESLGWTDARNHVLREWGIPTNVLVFDRRAILQDLQNEFEFHQQGGQTHVFVK